MNNTKSVTVNVEAVRKVILQGDLSSLSSEQKDSYYMTVCDTVGLNPLTKPFDFIKFNNKEVMYANKGCAEQLRMIHKIGLKVISKEKIDDVYLVTTEATDKDGRVDSATGAVNVSGLKGEALANAFMKAETKSKRRVTLSICGLNMLDETEVESVLTETSQSQMKSSIPLVTSVSSKPVENVQAQNSNHEDMVNVEAIVNFENKESAKECGFKWDKPSKKWLKLMSFEEFTACEFPFEIREFVI